MSKKSLIMGFFVVLIGVIFILTTCTFAEDTNLNALFNNESSSSGTIIFGDDPVNSVPSSTTSNEISENKNTTNKNTNTSNKNTNTSNKNSNTSNKNTNTTNNISGNGTANNTPASLSKAGLEDSIPTMLLVVIFTISAIYAYKKINDYKNV